MESVVTIKYLTCDDCKKRVKDTESSGDHFSVFTHGFITLKSSRYEKDRHFCSEDCLIHTLLTEKKEE